MLSNIIAKSMQYEQLKCLTKRKREILVRAMQEYGGME
jgi:hypothetical protein